MFSETNYNNSLSLALEMMHVRLQVVIMTSIKGIKNKTLW